ncbi:glycosyltransferase family 2 protein [Fulvivirgaceae bacterium BMA10]|uniref:Glycosyltransferase family 2 protein n=1 Tax=Splendidivirga corallicola TaxID=3051826 RepID=A0ABT8KZX7_9BACT|nr:glycosyltransferase family 2 protein [Fulvivirgaceae bacterium BMA10]
MIELSIIITVLNEEENIEPLLKSIYKALDSFDYEVIMVDDGSTDDTVGKIKRWANERVKLLMLYKNYGQTSALSAGIKEAIGKFIVTMDGDLQNDPADIPMMLKKIKESNCDVVSGVRAKRKDSFIIRKIPSKIANYIIRKTTNVHINDYGCAIRVFKADVAKNIGLYGELHRFIPALVQMQGAKILEVNVNHRPRIHGRSKYGLERTIKVMSDLLLVVFFQKYFQKPIHLFGSMGLMSFLIGMCINFYLLIEKIMGQDIWGRPLLLLGIVLTLGGIQLITSGFVAEMMVRTYFESQSKTTYRIKERFFGKEENQKLSEMVC